MEQETQDTTKKEGKPLGKKIGLPLIVWGTANAVAGIFFFLVPMDILKGILIQALFWGAIDAIIGLAAYLGKKETPLEKVMKSLKVNGVLDIGYMVIGVVLMAVTPVLDLPQGDITANYVIGSGIGIIIQGAFLLLADIHHIHMVKEMMNA